MGVGEKGGVGGRKSGCWGGRGGGGEEGAGRK